MASPEIAVRLTPRAGRNEISGERNGALLVRVTRHRWTDGRTRPRAA